MSGAPLQEEESSGQTRGLIELAVSRPVAVSMIVLAVAVFGYVSFKKLSVTLLPKISYPSLTVRTEYPGSAPAEVEELVTKPLESNIAVISNLTGFRSISRAGVSDVILEFEWDTDMSFAAQDVREKVDQVRAYLPQEVKKPLLLKYDPTLDPIIRLGIYAGDSLTRMRFFAEEKLKQRLEGISGVAAVRVKGGHESEIRVDLSETDLRQYGITVNQIKQRLAEENVNLASGILRDGDVEYLVRTLNQFRSVDEIRKLVISTRGTQLIRLREVATIRETFKEPDVTTRINGKPSVELDVYKEDSANIVTVAHDVKTVMFGPDWETRLAGGELGPATAETRGSKNSWSWGEKEQESVFKDDGRTLAESLPGGMKVRLLSDQSRFIENSIDEVIQTGLWGAFFAILVLLAFLRNWISTLIIAVSIPVSVIATFGPMMQFDVTLNIMSLGGLALGIGMLVDASIVVLESIDRCRREGDPVLVAAVRGTREVGGAVFASVLTTVAVFFPIVFVRGIAGEIFKDQALTVVFSLLTSLVVALFFIPMLASRSMAASQNPGDGTTGHRGRWPWFVQLLRQYSLARPSEWHAWRTVSDAGGKKGLTRIPLLLALLVISPIHAGTEFLARVTYGVCLVFVGLASFVIAMLMSLLRVVFWIPGRCFDHLYRQLERGYGVCLDAALGIRPLVLGAAVLLFAAALMKVDEIGLELIPEVHSGEIIVEAPQPIGTSLATTGSIAEEIENRIDKAWRSGKVDMVGHSSVVGVARDEIAPAGEGPHSTKVHLLLPRNTSMAESEAAVIASIREELSGMPEIGDLNFTSPQLFSFRNPLEIQISGDRLEQIDQVSRELMRRLESVEGLKDLKSTSQQGSPEFIIRYDRVELAKRGITLNQAATTLRDKIKGTIPTRFSVETEGRKIDILVKIPEDEITGIDDLRELQISSTGAPATRLADVAEILQGRGPSEVRHVAGERSVLITANPEDLDLSAAAARVEKVANEVRRNNPALFRNVAVRIGGQTEEARKSREELVFALLMALVLVYIVMASQFESLLDPLVIMVSSVFGGVGVIFALWLFQVPASVVVFIGAIMLAGIVVNNAIVLVDCINRLHMQGMPREEAIRKAGRMRLRPILMTTLTTVLGLLPMALSTGEGSEVRIPMAITVISGLTCATLLTLIIVPVVYSTAHALMERITGTPSRDEGTTA